MIVIASAVFKPEPVVSASISLDIANSLVETDEVVVLCPRPSRPLGYNFERRRTDDYRFKVEIQDSYIYPKSGFLGRLIESYSFGRSISNYVSKNHIKISVVYANVWPLFSQLMLAKVCSRYDIPLILHVQDVYPESAFNKVPIVGKFISSLFVPIDRYVLGRCSCVIAISNQMKKYLLETRNLETDIIKIARNWQTGIHGLSIDALQLSKRDAKFTFMYAGSVSPTADLKFVIDAFSRLDSIKVRLVIAGSGSEKSKCISMALANSADISFIDVTPDSVLDIQKNADVLILPLKKGVGKTALPSKLTAYMFSGKPVLAVVDADCETYGIIVSNECGWAVGSYDVEDLAKTMDYITRLPVEEIMAAGENSLQYAKNNLTREINLSVIISAIKTVKIKSGRA